MSLCINKDFTQIDEHLWLGSSDVMSDVGHSFVLAYDIRLVINCAIEIEYRNEAIPVLNIPFQDDKSQQLWPDICIASHLIEATTILGHNVYVHCAAGISRSPAVIIYHFMRTKNISFDLAYKLVKQKRNIISLNDGFINQLKSIDVGIIPKDRPIPFKFDSVCKM